MKESRTKAPETHFRQRSQKKNGRSLGKRQQRNQQNKVDKLYLQKSTEFMQIMKKQQCRRLNHELIEFHRRNFINKDSESHAFKQQWENKKHTEERLDIQIIHYQNVPDILLSATTMLCFAFTIWLANVEFFFGTNSHSFLPSQVYFIALGLVLVDFVRTKQLQLIVGQPKNMNRLLMLSKPLLCIIYLALKISAIEESQHALWLGLELPSLYILFTRASQFYKSFRVMSLSKHYEHHFKAFDLIFSLMLVAHIVVSLISTQAIILFQVAQAGQDITWMTELKIKEKSAFIQYIYSFYFGCTTILTVGYGDITPKNHIEIAVVCLIQLFGIAIFAYLISEIGYNLGTLRKDRELVQKDLSILQKCREYYKIDPSLIVKARSSLLNNKEAVNRLKPQEEHQLVMKLSEPLRQQISIHNSLSIIKSCIFFLCRWSKQFQKTLSLSLVSTLYTPGQQLYQPLGNQRIYIIRLGKVDFYRKQRGNKQEAKKKIKSLKVSLDTEVANNSFGYTAVIGRKPTALEVVSRDFTSAYFIDKDKFMRCVNESVPDFEYYHEIKDKLEQSSFPQAFEVPVLNSRQFHYTPPRSYLIKREKKYLSQLKNQRSFVRRVDWNKKVAKKDLIRSAIFNKKEVAQVRSAFISSLEEITLREQLQSKQSKSRASIDLNIDQKIIGTSVLHVGQVLAEVGTVRCLTTAPSVFQEQGKEYMNYYPSQNLEVVLQRYDLNLAIRKDKQALGEVGTDAAMTTIRQTSASME